MAHLIFSIAAGILAGIWMVRNFRDIEEAFSAKVGVKKDVQKITEE